LRTNADRSLNSRGVALVATKCPTCGTVGVYWNKTLLRR